MASPGASSVASESELREDDPEHQVRRTSHPPRCPSKDTWMEQAAGDRSAGKDLSHHLLQRWQKGVTLNASSNPLALAAQGATLERMLRSYLNSAKKRTVVN